MNLYCIKLSMFTKINNIKTKRKIATNFVFILVVLIVFLQSLELLMEKN